MKSTFGGSEFSTSRSVSVIPFPLDDSTLNQSSANQINALWSQAVEEYFSLAQLSEREKTALRRTHSPEDLLNLTRYGWEENIIQKRGKNHDMLVRIVSQVLGVFGIIDATLNFAVLFP